MLYNYYYNNRTVSEQATLSKVFVNFPSNTEILPIKADSGQLLCRQGQIVTGVYVLVKGRVSIVDNLQKDKIYPFTDFDPVELFGEQEILGNQDFFNADVVASTSVDAFFIAKSDYLSWVRSDVDVLMARTRNVVSVLQSQSLIERKSKFLYSSDRLAFYLIEYYERQKNLTDKRTIRVAKTRPEIADKIGYSLRTVNRAIDTLVEDDLINVDRGKIVISENHYKKLKKHSLTL